MIKKRIKISPKYNFVPDEGEKKALKELEGLAVNKYRMHDYSYQDSFSKIYVAVQHEVDMYEEGEESPLNKRSYNSAKKWLEKYNGLYEVY